MTDHEKSPAAAADLAARLGALSPEKQALLASKLAARAAERGVSANRIPPRADAGPAPLSHAQELLWLYEQMTPGTAAYNVPMARRVRGPLDVGALQRALDTLVARHAALRTRFVELDDAPRQVAGEPRALPVELHDLRGHAPDAREAEGVRLLQEMATRPFDLAAGTHPRVVVVRLADDEALLLVVAHHAVFDGASTGIFFRELAAAYEAAVDARDAELPPLPIQLADYAAWERRQLDDAHVAPGVAFWRETLAGAPSGIELPTDFPRGRGATGPGARYAVTFPAATRDAVRALAAAHDATPFMVLLAAYQTLLYRYSGQTDLVVGTPLAGRSRPGTEGLIGYLANMLPLRARFDDDPTFSALLRRVRDGALRAFEHQEVPYEKLVRELRAGLPAADQALFRVAFTLQDVADATLRLGAAALEGFGVELGAAKFDLTLSAAELPNGAGLRVAAEYRTDLFRADTIERFVDHLRELVAAAARAPATPVSRLAFLTEAERHQLLVEWNDTDAAWPTDATLHGLFDEQVRRRPDAVAVESEGVRLTYAELDRRANRLAWRLRALGVVPDALVAVCMEKSADTVAVLLGILKAGGAYVPIDPAYPDDRVAFMLEDSEARLVVTEPALVARLAPHGAVPVVAAEAWADASDASDAPDAPDAGDARDDAPPPSAGPANLCYVIYTSGSTGRPKGVLIEHRNVVRLLFNDRFQFDFDERDVWTVFHSFSFDFSVWEMYGALLYGGRVVVVPKEIAQQPAEYLALLEAHGVTVLNQVPSAFYALMQEELARPGARLSALRYVVFGGEALQPALLREWKARYPATTLVNMFGITETTVHVTFKVIGDAEIENGASNIGGPIPTLTTYVLDEHLALVPLGVTGELCVGGWGVARGYLKRPQLTAERFVPHPFRAGERMYRSGDLGRVRASGEIEYLGRRDHQVKLRGFRIELGEIEAALAQHPAVTACSVMVRTDGATGPRLVAYYVTAGAPIAHAALREWAGARLPDYMIPSAFVELPSLPITSNGKVDRKALPAPPAEQPNETFVAPRDDVETVVAGVWCAALGRERVGVETSFFDLGGHSLLATRIASQVTKIFRTQLPLRRFFAAPTVAGVARTLTDLEAKPGQAAAIASLLLKIQTMSPEERERLRGEKASTDLR